MTTLKEAARILDIPSASADGVRAITGHTLRVSGAQGLSRKGVELWAIQLLGGWGSSVVERYVSEVPLEAAAFLAAGISQDRGLQVQIKAAVEDALKVTKRSEELDNEVMASVRLVQKKASYDWVVNPWSGITHRLRSRRGAEAATTWCGWRCEAANALFKPAGYVLKCPYLVCGRCAPELSRG